MFSSLVGVLCLSLSLCVFLSASLLFINALV
uniref:Uncharacterized protein n=1 Tax=Rhizophora mucronata TaxID=61149 RepID=A0A2P2PEN6_RHIMU